MTFISENSHTLMLYAAMTLVTVAMRLLPYFVFANRKTPDFVIYLGKVLPFAIMGMLVIYCLKDVNFAGAFHGLPELAAIVIVAAIHVWKRNMILSIIAGTICYMLLIQFVFI